ncbi:hypothetical protein ACFPVX_19815 [Cohnella faecalis]|nr:hypothetical protein [Cohnella faecalis]
MNMTIRQLAETTSDLLYRVRVYDRDLKYSDEIIAMDDTHSALKKAVLHGEGGRHRERAIEKLQQMRRRLLTMMEDLLYTA